MNRAQTPLTHRLRSAWRAAQQPFGMPELIATLRGVGEILQTPGKDYGMTCREERGEHGDLLLEFCEGETPLITCGITGDVAHVHHQIRSGQADNTYWAGPDMLFTLFHFLDRLSPLIKSEKRAEFGQRVRDLREQVYPNNPITRAMRKFQNPDPQF